MLKNFYSVKKVIVKTYRFIGVKVGGGGREYKSPLIRCLRVCVEKNNFTADGHGDNRSILADL